MVWYFIGAYTWKRTLYGHLETRNRSLFVLKTISTPEEIFRISQRLWTVKFSFLASMWKTALHYNLFYIYFRHLWFSIHRLQNSPYFCLFNYALAVKHKRSGTRLKTEGETGERRKTLTPRFTDFFTDFEKKNRLFCSLFISQLIYPLNYSKKIGPFGKALLDTKKKQLSQLVQPVKQNHFVTRW